MAYMFCITLLKEDKSRRFEGTYLVCAIAILRKHQSYVLIKMI